MLTSEFEPFVFGLDRGLDGLAEYIERVGRERERVHVDGSESTQADDCSGEEEEPGGAAMDTPQGIGGEDPEVVAAKKYREAQKAVKQAQKVLAEARKRERQVLREAKERVAKRR